MVSCYGDLPHISSLESFKEGSAAVRVCHSGGHAGKAPCQEESRRREGEVFAREGCESVTLEGAKVSFCGDLRQQLFAQKARESSRRRNARTPRAQAAGPGRVMQAPSKPGSLSRAWCSGSARGCLARKSHARGCEKAHRTEDARHRAARAPCLRRGTRHEGARSLLASRRAGEKHMAGRESAHRSWGALPGRKAPGGRVGLSGVLPARLIASAKRTSI